MGQVFRARDTRLNRDVALKVLPEVFANDPDRLARFTREAQTLASLNHPNIAHLYGLEESGGVRALVMELVEGEDLSQRIARGALPLDEALLVAHQLAEALEAAHEQGIIHRDLKPANIMLKARGAAASRAEDRPLERRLSSSADTDWTVKVLDFGLAKAMDPPSAASAAGKGVSLEPTLTAPAMTAVGMILGTAAYMSPEQAKGRAADARSDIWAFGCVLYEMLAHRPPFGGDTVVEILGAIVMSEPDWSALPPTTPPALLSLLKRCLQRDRNKRMRDIADARFQIEEIPDRPSGPVASVVPPRRGRERLLWTAITLALASALTWSLVYTRGTPADRPEMRLEFASPPGADLSGFALSPDGRALVFQATADGKTQLWLRPMDSETATPLAGTENVAVENGSVPFWSPDSRSVGFFAGGQLKRIDIAGGLVQALAEAPMNTRGGAWNAEGTIVFTRSATEPLYRVPASGGKAVAATDVRAPHLGHRYPRFLPDGRHFLYFAYGPPESQGVYVGSLDSNETRRLVDAESAPIFAPPDYVLFARQGAVLAQRVNLDTLQRIGDPVPVARQVATPSGTVASVALSASAAGVVAYRADTGERQLRWVDRSGRPMGVLGAPDSSQPNEIRLSPDGRTVALTRMVNGNNDVWLIETARGVRQRFTSDPAREFQPVWSSDGSRLVFGSTRKGVVNLYERPVSGAGAETFVLESLESKNASDWSSDGRWIVFDSQSQTMARDLWALPMSGDKKPIAVAQTAADEADGVFSRDGRWIAYESNESGRREIYVQPFPGPGSRSQISTGGGTRARWHRDGKGLFYVDQANRLMTVPFATNGPRVEPGTPSVLFALSQGAGYEASTDGQRFLLNEVTKNPSPITIILNWKPPRQ